MKKYLIMIALGLAAGALVYYLTETLGLDFGRYDDPQEDEKPESFKLWKLLLYMGGAAVLMALSTALDQFRRKRSGKSK